MSGSQGFEVGLRRNFEKFSKRENRWLAKQDRVGEFVSVFFLLLVFENLKVKIVRARD